MDLIRLDAASAHLGIAMSYLLGLGCECFASDYTEKPTCNLTVRNYRFRLSGRSRGYLGIHLLEPSREMSRMNTAIPHTLQCLYLGSTSLPGMMSDLNTEISFRTKLHGAGCKTHHVSH